MEGETKSENTFIKAWNQLAHAFAPYIIQELHLIKANVYCSSSHHFSAIGLICGNLDLYILKSGLNISKIKRADKIENIADPVSALLYREIPLSLYRYNLKCYESMPIKLSMDSEEVNRLLTRITDYKTAPRYVIITNKRNLSRVVKKIAKNFESLYIKKILYDR